MITGLTNDAVCIYGHLIGFMETITGSEFAARITNTYDEPHAPLFADSVRGLAYLRHDYKGITFK